MKKRDVLDEEEVDAEGDILMIVKKWRWEQRCDLGWRGKQLLSICSATFGVTGIYNILSAVQKLNKCKENFIDDIKRMQEVAGDVSSVTASLSTSSGVQEELNKISEMKSRLRIREGESSMQSVVKSRNEANIYVNKLGIVHHAKKDLDRLSQSMLSKHHDERCELEEV